MSKKYLGWVHRGHRAVVCQVLLLELAHQLRDARVRVLSHGRVDRRQNLPQIHIGATLSDVPGQRSDRVSNLLETLEEH